VQASVTKQQLFEEILAGKHEARGIHTLLLDDRLRQIEHARRRVFGFHPPMVPSLGSKQEAQSDGQLYEVMFCGGGVENREEV
jgi:hypothetical protein